jgi:hypothetical protein
MTTLETPPSFIALDPSIDSRSSDELRLRLRDPNASDGFVDGGWWPRSRDLSVELPPLLAEMFALGYDIRRVTYNILAWNSPPRTVSVSGRLVKLGGYRTQGIASIGLVDTSHWNTAHLKRIELAVIPPETEPALAERALV